MAGEHTAAHVAALACHLPSDARVYAEASADAEWTLEHVLLASIRNALASLIWGMSDRRTRGPAPAPVGPSWMTRGSVRKLDARVLKADELMEELGKPRR